MFVCPNVCSVIILESTDGLSSDFGSKSCPTFPEIIKNNMTVQTFCTHLLQNINNNAATWRIICMYLAFREPGSSVSTVSGYGLEDREVKVRSQEEARRFCL
jgi:hypothetical protein